MNSNTSKTQQFALIEERSYLVLNEEERKQERKANGIFTLDGENDKKVKIPQNFAQTKSLPKLQSGSK